MSERLVIPDSADAESELSVAHPWQFWGPVEYLGARMPRDLVSMRTLVSLRDAVLRNQPDP